ncbi:MULTISPECIES: hypothetical protein [Bradyrhizobium]|uniref:Uncharacterized protein n=2 Tax=Bradyrhizobium TaxID=374 RepID=A0ABY0PM88_9BRAD|nr:MULTISPECIES: hypothetical protein [Bradyrhizobium]SDI54304.1 hypothetical protein SAMN05444163_3082 [Bradyrhizobium ottawaense]SED43161.1 hypothetical protein SAMN05444171_4087 [Bradyrhizobium lablabi]
MINKIRHTPGEAIKLPNGQFLNHGQIIKRGERKMKTNPARPLNTALRSIARDGAPKRTEPAPVKAGMKRVTKGEPSAYHHGQTVRDEPNTVKAHTTSIPLHPATPAKLAAKLDQSNNASTVLADASRLGRPAEKA